MRIHQTAGYLRHGEYLCSVYGCNRNYCASHRLLWRDCDTAKLTMQGSGEKVFEIGDCPKCEEKYHHEKMSEMQSKVI